LGCGTYADVGVLALIAFLLLRIESWPMRTAQQARRAPARAGQVQEAFIDSNCSRAVTINDRVVMEQVTSVAELSLVSPVGRA